MQPLHDQWLKRKFSEENTCTQCGQRVFPGAGITATKFTRLSSVEVTFCGERCGQDFHLANLNRTGWEGAPCDYDHHH